MMESDRNLSRIVSELEATISNDKRAVRVKVFNLTNMPPLVRVQDTSRGDEKPIFVFLEGVLGPIGTEEEIQALAGEIEAVARRKPIPQE